ncbi:MAG: 4-(cytidine 5'-diphospho)-2-C-methyl-D-erythritol kinase [Phycisphaerales bacterium]
MSRAREEELNEPLRCRAYAKINLCLSVGRALVGGPRAGFHPIASWFCGVDLWDEVELSARRAGRESEYAIEWADDAPRVSLIDWPLERDLCVRAHRLMERAAGRGLPVRLRLTKRIPVGGGLGGGSSDAATMLRGVNHLFGLAWSKDRLAALATELGSDVGYFVRCGAEPGARGGGLSVPACPAIVGGLGGEVEPVELVGARVVLVAPSFGCATGAVYAAFDDDPREVRPGDVREMVKRATERGRIEPGELFNDLTEPACRVQPRLREVMASVGERAGRAVHMSGSGSTLFVLTDEAGDGSAESIAAKIAPDLAPAACIATRLV